MGSLSPSSLYSSPGDQVALVGGDDLSAGGKVDLIAGELAVDRHNVFNGITSLGAGGVDNMDQNPGPFQMGKELMAQSRAVRGTLDQTRNISHNKSLCVLQIHYAEDRPAGL